MNKEARAGGLSQTQAEGEWERGDSWETRQELRLMRSEWILCNDKKHKPWKGLAIVNSVCIQQHSPPA